MKKIKEEDTFIEESLSIFKPLEVKKRSETKTRSFLFDSSEKRKIKLLNDLVRLYCDYETQFEINKGDVFLMDFELSVGNELSGRHFVVALSNSNVGNQLVTIVPLHSGKQDKVMNPASELLLGVIPGILNGKNSVAIINQIKTVDKRRIFDKKEINDFLYLNRDGSKKVSGKMNVQYKVVYRLSDKQFKKLRNAVHQFVFNGYIKH